MAITLGKDATISVGGGMVGVRDVTLTHTARTIDIEAYGLRLAEVYSTGYDASLSMELNDDTSLGSLFSALQNGQPVVVSGGAGSWSFDAIISGISERASIDGVVTFQIEARMTKPGLRS